MSSLATSSFDGIELGGRRRGSGLGLSINIELDRVQQRRLEVLLAGISRGMPRARSAAIRRTATFARGGSARAINKELNVPLKPIRDQITKAATGAVVTIGDRRLSLARFGARQGKTALSYQIRRGGPRRRIKRAWIADPRAGGRPLGPGATGGNATRSNVVFGRAKGDGRLPFFAVRGPSPAEVAQSSSRVQRFIRQEVTERLERELLRQVDRLTGSRRAVA